MPTLDAPAIPPPEALAPLARPAPSLISSSPQIPASTVAAKQQPITAPQIPPVGPWPARMGALGLVALVGLVVAPGVASATDLVGLPPELGSWGLVAAGLVAVVERLLARVDQTKAVQEAQGRAQGAEAKAVELERRLREIEEREDAAREARLRELEARLERAEKEGGR